MDSDPLTMSTAGAKVLNILEAVVCAGLTCAYVTEVAAWRPNLFTRLLFICPRSEPTGGKSLDRYAALRSRT